MADDWGQLVIQQEQKLAQRVDGLNISGSNKSTGSASSSITITSPTSSNSGSVSARGPSVLTINSAVLPPSAQGAAFNVNSNNSTPARTGGFGAQASTNGSANNSFNLSVNGSGASGGTSDDDQEEKEVKNEDVALLRKLLHSKLINSKKDIEDLRRNPNSPLHSVKSFEALNLKPELLKGVYEMGFNAPSKIQETALPTLLADPPVNMIAQSQSGTGKTAAFALTMLSRVDISVKHPQCLCLAPTYELALQIGDVLEKMSKFMTGLKICYAIRGNHVTKNQILEDHIVIGTPGTVSDWSKFKALPLERLKVFVLDEADVMISMQGHQDQSTRIQKKLSSSSCQMLLFSATYDDSVMKFAEKIIPNDPVIIRLRREEESLENIKQYYIECSDPEDKYRALCNIYGSISVGQSMIFCHKRKTASWLAAKMTKDKHAVGLLSGELTIEQRAAIIKRFRDGKEKVLITTNVSARGIDVEMVTVVVNFDLPVTVEWRPDCETYLHRIGRTGRFGKNGIAINMVDGPRSMAIMKSIEQHFGRKIMKLDTEDLDEIEKIGS